MPRGRRSTEAPPPTVHNTGSFIQTPVGRRAHTHRDRAATARRPGFPSNLRTRNCFSFSVLDKQGLVGILPELISF